jgi:acyl-CoA thioester hydrolase
VTQPVEPYELHITVQPDHIDVLGHVNNVVYLQWVQDAAVAHWQAAASSEAQAALLWVTVRHEIDYQRPAFLEDEVVARTWVGESHGRDFERLTELRRASDGKVLAKARTLWCPIDAKTFRPTDVSADVREKFSIPSAPPDE